MNTADWIDVILADPLDDSTRLACADWCDEAGRDDVAGWLRLWVGDRRKVPAGLAMVALPAFAAGGRHEVGFAPSRFGWERGRGDRHDAPDQVPPAVFDVLAAGPGVRLVPAGSPAAVLFDTRNDAFRALFTAVLEAQS